MKQILLVLSVLCLHQMVLGAFTDDDVLPAQERECLKELNVPASLMIENFNPDFTIPEGNSDINNVMLCWFDKVHQLNDDKSMNFVKIKEVLVEEFFQQANMKFDNPEEVATNAINSCRAIQGSDAADTSVKIYNCIIKYLRNHELH